MASSVPAAGEATPSSEESDQVRWEWPGMGSGSGMGKGQCMKRDR